MKTRQGFVSNSSSSSFVVLVNEMTEEQKTEFRNKVNAIDWEEICYDYGEPLFSSSGKVFGGEVDYAAQSKVSEILESMDLYKLMEYLS